MDRQLSNPFTRPDGTIPGADCLTTGSCQRTPSFLTVATTAALKALEEEIDLENNPNGSAQIRFGTRVARFVLRGAYHAADINAINMSRVPGYNCNVNAGGSGCLYPNPLLNPAQQPLFEGDAPNTDRLQVP